MDVEVFDIARKYDMRSHAWFGSSLGGLHFDRFDTILTQVRGDKTIILSTPESCKYMYPNASSHVMPNHSRAGFMHWVDTEVSVSFPNLEKIEFQRVHICLLYTSPSPRDRG